MTDAMRNICHGIIHGHAAAAGAGNFIPVPGMGVAVDLLTMTTMTMALATAFGGSISHSVAEGLAVQGLKDTALKQPLKVISKELAKLIPYGGQLFASAISIALMEAAGWSIAFQLDSGILKGPVKVPTPKKEESSGRTRKSKKDDKKTESE